MLKHFLETIGAERFVKRIVRPLWPRWRAANERERQELYRILRGLNPVEEFSLARFPSERSLLVVGYVTAGMVAVQVPLLLAARIAGYRVSILLPVVNCASSDFYRAMGATLIIGTESLDRALPLNRARRLLGDVKNSADLLRLEDSGVSVGKFAASTLMRQTRSAHIDPTEPTLRAKLLRALALSLRAGATASRVLDKVQPDLVVFYDRGYTPDGELFELSLARGAKAITINTAHKSGYLLFKRYTHSNKDTHPASLSAETWQKLLQIPWATAHWDALRQEIRGCYESGTWYDEVGTQFNTKIVSKRELVESLRLDPSKPTVVIFPHLFWDATFFWGTDVFDDYKDWFVNVLRAAAANKELNWIVKIHPANLVKNRRDNYSGEYSESLAIRETLLNLPPHLRVIAPDSPISTLSLYEVMDYCLTVRGTVGLEAAVFGKQVLTAGTGRYDGFGFTIDSLTRKDYLERLARLHLLPQPTEQQTEAARRFAYGLFLLRPLHTTCMQFRYDQNERASLKTELRLEVGQSLENCSDLQVLADWLVSSTEDLVGTRNAGVPTNEAPAVRDSAQPS